MEFESLVYSNVTNVFATMIQIPVAVLVLLAIRKLKNSFEYETIN